MSDGFHDLNELQGLNLPANIPSIPPAEVFGRLGFQGLGLAAAPAPVINAGLFGILGLQGIVVHGQTFALGGLRLLSLTGVMLPEIGVPAQPTERVKKANWGSWCRNVARIVP